MSVVRLVPPVSTAMARTVADALDAAGKKADEVGATKLIIIYADDGGRVGVECVGVTDLERLALMDVVRFKTLERAYGDNE